MKLFLVTFVVCVVCFAGIAHAKQPPQGSATVDSWHRVSLDIKAPEKLILGQDRTASISFDKPEGFEPILITNVGSISKPKTGGTGRLKATYKAPKQTFPQVAIIAILDQERLLLDWIALPLYGQARIDSKTERGASVSIEIAGETFGPVVAGNNGKTRIDVVVPPGVEKGFTIATDEVGNTKKTPTALGNPTFNRMLGVCPVTGDRFYVLVVDPSGKPTNKVVLDVMTSKGTLSEPVVVADGVYVSMLDVSSEVVEGEDVSLTGMFGKYDTSCELEFAPAPPVDDGTGEPGVSDGEKPPYVKPPLTFGPRIGYVTNFVPGKISTFLFLADLIYSPPFLDRNLSIGLESGFYYANWDRDADTGESVETTVWTIPILARLSYQIPFEPLAVYFGLGGGIIINYTNRESLSASNDGVTIPFGSMSGLLGMDFILGPGRAVLEIEYLPGFIDSLNGGGLDGLFVTLGYRFDLLYK